METCYDAGELNCFRFRFTDSIPEDEDEDEAKRISFPGGEEMQEAVDNFAGQRRTRLSKVRRRIRRKAQLPRTAGRDINGKSEQLALCYALGLGMRSCLTGENNKANGDGHTRRRFESSGDNLLRHHFKFKEYSRSEFADIRCMFGLEDASLVNSICGGGGDPKLVQLNSNSRSFGSKFGQQFLFTSHDGRFVVKTMNKVEAHFLLEILGRYRAHLKARPGTLLPRFLGMYRVKLHHLQAVVYFVVMGSVYNLRDSTQRVFDLKGSTLGRNARPGEKIEKDNDFREAMNSFQENPKDPRSFALRLGESRALLLAQARSDAEFLMSLDIVDYSLMVASVPDGDEDLEEPSPLMVVSVPEAGAHCGEDVRKQPSFLASSNGLVRPTSPYESDSCTEDEDGLRRLRLSPKNVRLFIRPPTRQKSVTLASFSPKKTSGRRLTKERLEGGGAGSSFGSDEDEARLSPETMSGRRLTSSALGFDEDEACLDDDTGGRRRLRRFLRQERTDEEGHDPRTTLYFFGIIDILSTYRSKWGPYQQAYKSKILGHDRIAISIIDSETYCRRFLEFLEKHTL